MNLRKVAVKNRVVIPGIMLEGIGVKVGDLVDVNYEDKTIIITNPQAQNQRIKTKKEMEEKLHNLNELIKEGVDDERLLGSIDMLEWILDTKRDEFDFLNDYDDYVEDQKLG